MTVKENDAMVAARRLLVIAAVVRYVTTKVVALTITMFAIAFVPDSATTADSVSAAVAAAIKNEKM
jgi:hypothetical protein